MSVIAKFYVQTVERQGYNRRATEDGSLKPQTTGVKVNLGPVYDPKGEDSENNKFWEATPSGQLWMQINNPTAFDYFNVGHEQYLIFVDASEGQAGLISSLESLLASLRQ